MQTPQPLKKLFAKISQVIESRQKESDRKKIIKNITMNLIYFYESDVCVSFIGQKISIRIDSDRLTPMDIRTIESTIDDLSQKGLKGTYTEIKCEPSSSAQSPQQMVASVAINSHSQRAPR